MTLLSEAGEVLEVLGAVDELPTKIILGMQYPKSDRIQSLVHVLHLRVTKSYSTQ